MAWYSFGEEDYQAGELLFSRKAAGADSFLETQHVPLAMESSAGNPVVFEDSKTGALHLLFSLIKGSYWTDTQVMESISNDGGQSWSPAAVIISEAGSLVRHAPVPHAGHHFLLPAYRERENESILLSHEGGEWNEFYCFKGAPLIQPQLVRIDEKHFSMFFRPCGDPRVIWRASSADGGHSWSEPIQTALPCPLSGIACVARQGRLYMIYNHTQKHERSPLSIARSNDGGTSWSKPMLIDNSAERVSYPSAVFDSEGNLHLVYTYNRRMIKYVQLDFKELP